MGAERRVISQRPAALPEITRSSRKRVLGERYIQYWLIIPAIVAMCSVLIYPLAYSLWISFFDWNIASAGHRFLGLRNYKEAFTGASSGYIYTQTILFTVICIVLEFVLGMALALLMSQP